MKSYCICNEGLVICIYEVLIFFILLLFTKREQLYVHKPNFSVNWQLVSNILHNLNHPDTKKGMEENRRREDMFFSVPKRAKKSWSSTWNLQMQSIVTMQQQQSQQMQLQNSSAWVITPQYGYNINNPIVSFTPRNVTYTMSPQPLSPPLSPSYKNFRHTQVLLTADSTAEFYAHWNPYSEISETHQHPFI